MSLQRYISIELTHFVGRGKPEDEQYSLLIRILKSGWLTHPPHDPTALSKFETNGPKLFSTGERFVADIVCFCDIPVEDLPIHMQKYSQFGIAFPKTFLF